MQINSPTYKVITYFKENKKVGFLLLGILFLLIYFFSSMSSGNTGSLSPFFKLRQQNYTSPVNTTIQNTSTVLYLTKTFPPSGEYASYDPFEVISFEFSSPVSYLSAQISVSPKLNITILPDSTNANVIHIMPKDLGWQKNIQYQVTIDKIVAKNGASLNSSFVHFFKPVEPAEWLDEPMAN